MTGGVALDQHRLGKRMMILHMLRRRMMQSLHNEKEIVPGQYPLLKYLNDHPGASQQELANMLFVSPASVAQSTKRLQNAGLLEKATDPDNLRKNRLRITAAGQAVVHTFHSLVDQVDRMSFTGFSEQEMTQLLEMHNRMIKNLATNEDLSMLREIEQQDRIDAKK
jgi:DNA-binding MarR family transcriptional regulator